MILAIQLFRTIRSVKNTRILMYFIMWTNFTFAVFYLKLCSFGWRQYANVWTLTNLTKGRNAVLSPLAVANALAGTFAHTPAAADEQCGMHLMRRYATMGRHVPLKAPFRVGLDPRLKQYSLSPLESSPKRHLDRFSRFMHNTHTQTDTHTTLRAASLATDRIYALRTGDVAEKL